jgi:hypothetical protein
MTEDRPVADGIVEKRPDGSIQVRFIRRLPHPIARVWAALTDPPSSGDGGATPTWT